MSCSNTTAPINIEPSKAGTCYSQCNYSFNYLTSKCTARNLGNYVSILYDNQSSPPVTYNSDPYNVQELRIYTPSLHAYSGNKADGELIIIHTSLSGNSPLLVCIPIKKTYSTNISSVFFKSVVDTMSKLGPSSNNEYVNVDIPNFNLSLIVPRKKFYSYNATMPYQDCNPSTNYAYIVYYPSDASLYISEETYNKLTSLISANPYDVKSGVEFFVNENGPSSIGGNSEIYIDCQPVGESDKDALIVTGEGEEMWSFDSIINSNLFMIIIGVIICFIILYFIKNIVNSTGPRMQSNFPQNGGFFR